MRAPPPSGAALDLDRGRADHDHVPGLKAAGALELLAVDHRAVQGAEILDLQRRVGRAHYRMPAGDQRILDRDVGVRPAENHLARRARTARPPADRPSCEGRTFSGKSSVEVAVVTSRPYLLDRGQCRRLPRLAARHFPISSCYGIPPAEEAGRIAPSRAPWRARTCRRGCHWRFARLLFLVRPGDDRVAVAVDEAEPGGRRTRRRGAANGQDTLALPTRRSQGRSSLRRRSARPRRRRRSACPLPFLKNVERQVVREGRDSVRRGRAEVGSTACPRRNVLVVQCISAPRPCWGRPPRRVSSPSSCSSFLVLERARIPPTIPPAMRTSRTIATRRGAYFFRFGPPSTGPGAAGAADGCSATGGEGGGGGAVAPAAAAAEITGPRDEMSLVGLLGPAGLGADQRLAHRRGELRRGGIAVVHVLRHRLSDDAVHLGRQIGPLLRGGRRRLEQVRVHEGNFRILLVRRRAGQRLVQDAAERVHVGAAVEARAPRSAPAPVVGRAHEHAGLRQRRRARCFASPKSDRYSGRPSCPPDDRMLAGFTSRWTSPRLVRGVQRARHLAPDRLRHGRRQRAPGSSTQVRAADEAHRYVEDAARVAGLVDRNDVRVVERAARRDSRVKRRGTSRPGSTCMRIFSATVRSRRGCSSAVDDAHPAAANHLFQPVAGELRSDLWHPGSLVTHAVVTDRS